MKKLSINLKLTTLLESKLTIKELLNLKKILKNKNKKS